MTLIYFQNSPELYQSTLCWFSLSFNTRLIIRTPESMFRNHSYSICHVLHNPCRQVITGDQEEIWDSITALLSIQIIQKPKHVTRSCPLAKTICGSDKDMFLHLCNEILPAEVSVSIPYIIRIPHLLMLYVLSILAPFESNPKPTKDNISIALWLISLLPYSFTINMCIIQAAADNFKELREEIGVLRCEFITRRYTAGYALALRLALWPQPNDTRANMSWNFMAVTLTADIFYL